MTLTYYVGLDVHKETIAIAYALGGSRKPPVYAVECGGSNLAAERALRRVAGKLGMAIKDLKVCYESSGARWMNEVHPKGGRAGRREPVNPVPPASCSPGGCDSSGSTARSCRPRRPSASPTRR